MLSVLLLPPRAAAVAMALLLAACRGPLQVGAPAAAAAGGPFPGAASCPARGDRLMTALCGEPHLQSCVVTHSLAGLQAGASAACPEHAAAAAILAAATQLVPLGGGGTCCRPLRIHPMLKALGPKLPVSPNSPRRGRRPVLVTSDVYYLNSVTRSL